MSNLKHMIVSQERHKTSDNELRVLFRLGKRPRKQTAIIKDVWIGYHNSPDVLKGANIKNVQFNNMLIDGHILNFSNMQLSDVVFSSCTIRNVTISDSKINNVVFSHCEFENLKIAYSEVSLVSFGHCQFDSVPSISGHKHMAFIDCNFHRRENDFIFASTLVQETHLVGDFSATITHCFGKFECEIGGAIFSDIDADINSEYGTKPIEISDNEILADVTNKRVGRYNFNQEYVEFAYEKLAINDEEEITKEQLNDLLYNEISRLNSFSDIDIALNNALYAHYTKGIVTRLRGSVMRQEIDAIYAIITMMKAKYQL